MNKINLKDLTYQQLEKEITDLGEPKFRAAQIFKWLYRGVKSFSEMTDINNKLKDLISERFFISQCVIYKKYVSKLDGTIKYLIKLEDGNIIESVLMTYKHGKTICISSQVGCRMGCKFCASTIGGLVRNLSAGEIVDQILTVSEDVGERISNVVMMGIGEPLDNFDNVVTFLENVNHRDGLNIGYRHISISTCGLVDKINKLRELNLPITLSISLHAPTDIARSEIMPINKKYNVNTLIDACRRYVEFTKRRISFEYAMIENVTDTPKLAYELSGKLKNMLCHVNLIPVNTVEERSYKKSSKANIDRFIKILESNKITVTVRRELGPDISASCGQLRRSEITEVNRENDR